MSTQRPTVHLLVVHGVGGHDHLSNLLRTYQTFRANLTSVDVPVTFEDQIPGWRLAHVNMDGSPASLRLERGDEDDDDDAAAVCLYEVNYSGLAGVVRRNHPVGLTQLFLGLDQAACAARQRSRTRSSQVFGSGTAALGHCLQRVSGVLAAGTVPIIGLPSIVFRDYIGTFVATFTRFFEDVTTFALDKNGEQLISAHFDRTLAGITTAMGPTDRLVVAAHSLGSVVAHNHIVRNWTRVNSRLPETLITFGSPIGLVAWLWLFLDFEDMRFDRPIRGGQYFCWNPVSNGVATRTPLSWVNVVNCADPIATAFPTGALDLSAGTWDIVNGLKGKRVAHRYVGAETLGSVGASHTEYLNDKEGFLAILLSTAGLTPGEPTDVEGRSDDEHRQATGRLLVIVQLVTLAVALMAIVAYCGLVARRFDDPRVVWTAVPFAWPLLTIEVLAFFQRLMFGGPTKRIQVALIRELRWWDLASFPYRLRERILRTLGCSRDVDPAAHGTGYAARLAVSVLAFAPTLAFMVIPIAVGARLTEAWPTAQTAWARVWSAEALAALALFAIYVVACAAHELVRSWRRALRILR